MSMEQQEATEIFQLQTTITPSDRVPFLIARRPVQRNDFLIGTPQGFHLYNLESTVCVASWPVFPVRAEVEKQILAGNATSNHSPTRMVSLALGKSRAYVALVSELSGQVQSTLISWKAEGKSDSLGFIHKLEFSFPNEDISKIHCFEDDKLIIMLRKFNNCYMLRDDKKLFIDLNFDKKFIPYKILDSWVFPATRELFIQCGLKDFHKSPRKFLFIICLVENNAELSLITTLVDITKPRATHRFFSNLNTKRVNNIYADLCLKTKSFSILEGNILKNFCLEEYLFKKVLHRWVAPTEFGGDTPRSVVIDPESEKTIVIGTYSLGKQKESSHLLRCYDDNYGTQQKPVKLELIPIKSWKNGFYQIMHLQANKFLIGYMSAAKGDGKTAFFIYELNVEKSTLADALGKRAHDPIDHQIWRIPSSKIKGDESINKSVKNNLSMAWKSEKEQIAIIEKIENTWKTDIEEFYKILNENFFNPEKTESEKLKISKRKKIISIAKAHNDQLAKVAPNDIKAISNQKELKKAKKGRVISAQTITRKRIKFQYSPSPLVMRSCFYRLFLREEEYSPEYFRKLMKIRASNASDGWLENGGILKALIKRRDYFGIKLAINRFSDIPETSLVYLLREVYAMSHKPETATIVAEGEKGKEEEEGKTTSLNNALSMVIKYQYDTNAMVRALKQEQLNQTELEAILRICVDWMDKIRQERIEDFKDWSIIERHQQKGIPELDLIVKFVGELMDAKLFLLITPSKTQNELISNVKRIREHIAELNLMNLAFDVFQGEIESWKRSEMKRREKKKAEDYKNRVNLGKGYIIRNLTFFDKI